jgi:hypothetical protein
MLRVANRYSACQSTLGEDHSRRERLIAITILDRCLFVRDQQLFQVTWLLTSKTPLVRSSRVRGLKLFAVAQGEIVLTGNRVRCSAHFVLNTQEISTSSSAISFGRTQNKTA